MMQAETLEQKASETAVDDEIGLVDILIVLAKNKKKIIASTVVAAAMAAALSFVLPNEYRATAKLLPPQQSQSGAAALLSQLGGVAGMAAGAAGLKSQNDMYIGMLESRTLLDKLVNRFALKKVYDIGSQELARKRLDDNTSITTGKDGLIVIEVTGRDEKLVAPIANAYVDELMALTRVLALTEASQRRMFFEQQLERAKDNLATAEMKLKHGLNAGGVISVDSDSRSILETVARLRAQASVKEIQLDSMSKFVTRNNPEFRRAEEELKSLRGELSRLENGRGSPGLSPAQGRQGGLENIKVLRDVKYYHMLYELLAKQYEVARLDEAKDSAVIQVLDRAIDPEQKYLPKRSLIVTMGAVLGFVLALGWAFAVEARHRAMRQPANAKRWAEFKSHLSI